MHRVQKKKSHEIHSFDWESQREKDEISLTYSDDIRETTTDLSYKHIDLAILLSQLGQNYLDSQRFYFHLLVLIGPARFHKSFLQCLVSLSDCEKMSLSDCSNVCLPCWLHNLWTSAGDCFSSDTKNEFGFPAEFSAAIVHLSLLSLLILSQTLGQDFVLRPLKIPFTIYHKL